MDKHRINVLYVDDEEGNLTAFKATFRRDFQVHVAVSAEAALTLLEQHPIHVVISDQRMPGTTGSQFLTIVREKYPRTIRMLLTGYSDIEAVVEAINKGGIYSYCTKPWDPNDLKLRIEQAYEVHSLRDQREQLMQRYRQVFESSGDPVVILDTEGHLLDGNPATLKLLGVSAEALRGLTLGSLLETPEQLEQAVNALKEGRAFVNADITLRAPNGHTIDCLVTLTALGPSPDGRPLAQAMIKDITDRKQEENRLRKLNEDLDRRVSVRTRQLLDALEDLGSFSYTVAHDLRSPLKNMLALSEHLNEQSAPEAREERELVHRIHKGAARMLQLVDDLLRFSHTNTREVQRAEVSVLELVKETIADHVPSDRLQQVHIEVSHGSTLSADKAMLSVALGNLLSNALKYTRGTASPAIVVGHRIDGEQHVIWVTDNGVGFDSDKTDQAFGAFKRLHRADQFEGTGVGLSIVQRIVAKHGGRAMAESAPGKGTTVTISLPRTPVLEQQLPFAS